MEAAKDMPAASNNSAVIVERLETLRSDVADVRNNVSQLHVFYREFHDTHTVEQERISEEMRHQATRIDAVEKRLGIVEQGMHPLIVWGKIFAFVATMMGGSIVALIWSILTHQVTLVFP